MSSTALGSLLLPPALQRITMISLRNFSSSQSFLKSASSGATVISGPPSTKVFMSKIVDGGGGVSLASLILGLPLGIAFSLVVRGTRTAPRSFLRRCRGQRTLRQFVTRNPCAQGYRD